MNVTLFEIRNMVIPLRKLASCEMPIKTSWKILKLSEELEKINQKIEQFRIELVKKYGEEVYECTYEDGTKANLHQIEVEADKAKLKSISEAKIEVLDQEKLKKFAEEFQSLLEQEEEIPVSKLKLEDFSENTKLSPQDLYYLQKIFEE